MSDLWSERAEAYRTAVEQREGEDLDRLVEWCEPGEGVHALDVATGGGHVARRLREAGCTVTTLDPAAGMEPDIVAPAEEIPLDSGSVDVAVTRIAAHHFDDVSAAVAEMARVSRKLVVVEDTLFADERVEEAEALRDPTHVSSYTEAEWRDFLDAAQLDVEDVDFFEKRRPVDAWLARTGCVGEDAVHVRWLLAEHIVDGEYVDRKILLKARKRS